MVRFIRLQSSNFHSYISISHAKITDVSNLCATSLLLMITNCAEHIILYTMSYIHFTAVICYNQNSNARRTVFFYQVYSQ